MQVTPLNRPLPPGEGWGEGPATSDSSISSHPLSEVGWVSVKRRIKPSIKSKCFVRQLLLHIWS